MDSEKMFASGCVQVFAPNSGKKLVINTVKNNKSKISVPLTVECPGAGWYSFELAELELESGIALLEDKLTGEIKDLTIDSVLNFYANSGVLANRFVLHFHIVSPISNPVGPSTLDDLMSSTQESVISISANSNGKVAVEVVNNQENEMSEVRILNLSGQVIENFNASGSKFDFNLSAGQGVYIVEVKNGVVTEFKKVFVQ